MSDTQPLPPRRLRGVRLLVASWDRLALAADAANTLGVRTRRREVLDALVEAHAPGSPRQAGELIREHRRRSDTTARPTTRELRLLESSWDALAKTTEAANAHGMATREREVLDALIERYAPTDAAKAAKLVKAHRVRQYGTEDPPRVRG